MRGVGEKNRRQRSSAGAVNNVYATARNLTGLSKSRQAQKPVTSLSLTVITIYHHTTSKQRIRWLVGRSEIGAGHLAASWSSSLAQQVAEEGLLWLQIAAQQRMTD